LTFLLTATTRGVASFPFKPFAHFAIDSWAFRAVWRSFLIRSWVARPRLLDRTIAVRAIAAASHCDLTSAALQAAAVFSASAPLYPLAELAINVVLTWNDNVAALSLA